LTSVVHVAAQVPSLQVVVDERMKELAEVAHYHHISIFSDLFETAEENILKWLQRIPFDGEAFYRNHKDIGKEHHHMFVK
jgi:hypothetical protein